ncbi:right-handed parallel beta-helix repeat-containing protein [Niabella drilacis]|uniref:Polymorphic outer membrane protein repeat-containing protein n=1 Tax=Niabella drilacis (strain DSM 25811 / CCM 8410 / CCUG 62505 / LMG 26954 / E90) TaxID=1285928 RepID=A0A1G6MTR2_NIADE|nr:right-handed parallel beta-helix repeat-containing protein [Niabella drilacis]SDC58811.1 hypothetical protein SAMN04487894_10332 [Niabella drilacis]
MKKSQFLLLFCLCWAGALRAQFTPGTGNILYVNKQVTGGNHTGNSWANAVPELAEALKWANTNKSSWTTANPLQIWVATGVYKPMYSPADDNFGNNADRDNAFLMVSNVRLYGGFDPANGIISLTDKRILPGSGGEGSVLSGDRGVENDNTDNAYHVLIAGGGMGVARLDGFTVTGGNADQDDGVALSVGGGAVRRHFGSGMFNVNNASPIVTHSSFTRNTALGGGGGMYNYINASPTISYCTFSENTADFGGGGMCNEVAYPVITYSTFWKNTANRGGGIYNHREVALKATNVLFSDNTVTNLGGGIFDNSEGSIFTNVTLVNNNGISGLFASGITYWNNSIVWDDAPYTNAVAHNSLFKDSSNTANGNIDATGLSGTDIFNNFANGDYRLKSGAPAINAGNNQLYTDAGGDLNNDQDLAGNPRLAGSAIDIGAYEFSAALPVLFGPVSATIKNGRVLVSWTTETETNNDHFLLQLSPDGVHWKTVQTIQSKATAGNSNTVLEYNSTIPLTTLSLGFGMLLLGALASTRRRHAFAIAAAICCALAFSCHKNTAVEPAGNGKLFVRIVQIDKDGTKQLSKVLQATPE